MMCTTPCMDCKIRHILCHSTCHSYREWRGDLDAINKERKQYISSQSLTDSHMKMNFKNLKQKLSGSNPRRGCKK